MSLLLLLNNSKTLLAATLVCEGLSTVSLQAKALAIGSFNAEGISSSSIISKALATTSFNSSGIATCSFAGQLSTPPREFTSLGTTTVQFISYGIYKSIFQSSGKTEVTLQAYRKQLIWVEGEDAVANWNAVVQPPPASWTQPPAALPNWTEEVKETGVWS